MTNFKEFKGFFPFSFTPLSEKGADIFGGVMGLVDRFDKSRGKIATGVENTSDESMSKVCFSTTPKGDLPHY